MTERWYARPVIGVSAVDAAVDFYIGRLGFSESWRRSENGVAIVAEVERAGCELILSSQWHERVGRGPIFISLNPSELEAARTEFENAGVEMREGEWGYRIVIVTDPDGNQLYFPYGDGL